MTSPPHRERQWLPALLTLGAVALLALTYAASPAVRAEAEAFWELLVAGDADGLRERILSFGTWAPLLSLVLMVVQAIAAPIPAFLITFANGLAFGLLGGWLLSLLGHTVAAGVCFALSRTLGRQVIALVVSRASLARADRWFDDWGLYAVLAARLIPGVSFDLVSYAAGMTRMSWLGFLGATTLGVAPQTFLYAFLGDRVPESIWLVLILNAALVVAVGAAVVAIRRASPGRRG